ncbi:MAG: hypothetical protein PHS54_00615 [Clostridia bacterium]|nr:hypothetical protein [Clostridia bacterium]
MKNKQNKIEEIIEETMDAGGTLFGGAAYGGSGTFSYSQQAGAKTWAPRSTANRSTGAEPQGYNVKDIGDEEHLLHHKAPKKRPFPLETINDSLAQAYLQLCNAEIQLKTCNKYNSVMELNMEKKALLKHLHKKTKALKIMIKNMADDLDRISFS